MRKNRRFVKLDFTVNPAVATVYVGRTQESVWTIGQPLSAAEVEALRTVDPNKIAPQPGEVA